MSRAVNAAKLDYLTGRSTYGTFAVLLVLAAAVGIMSKQPLITMIIAMIFAVYLGGTVFSAHEKSNSDKLYGILPLTRAEMIAGRYLYGFVIGVAGMAIASALTLIVSLIRGVQLNSFTFWGALTLSFVYFCFALGVSYPIYMRFSFAKAYVFTMLPMYLIGVAAMLITSKTDLLNGIAQGVQFFADKQYLLPVFGLLIGLILLAVSAVIANLIYAGKEI